MSRAQTKALYALAFALATGLVNAQSVLYELPVAHATVYYDVTNQYCDAVFGPQWGITSGINAGTTKCEQWAGANAKSLNQIGSNRIAAMHSGMVHADPDKWCGKEVVIYDAEGKKFEFSEGPIYIWDGCDACVSTPIIDLSAKAFVELKGGDCGGDNPHGLRVQIVDNQIVQPVLQGSEGSSSHPGAGAGPAPAPPVVSTPAAVPAVPSTPAAAPEVPPAAPSAPAPVPAPAPVVPAPEVNPPPAAPAAPSVPLNSLPVLAPIDPTTPTKGEVPSSGATPSEEENCDDEEPTPPQAENPSAGSGSAACQYGHWKCDGKELKVCNVQSDRASFVWQTIETCAEKCEVTASGSVDCQ